MLGKRHSLDEVVGQLEAIGWVMGGSIERSTCIAKAYKAPSRVAVKMRSEVCSTSGLALKKLRSSNGCAGASKHERGSSSSLSARACPGADVCSDGGRRAR